MSEEIAREPRRKVIPPFIAQIVDCFYDVDLRQGHKGLGLLAKKHSVRTENLEPGRMVVFINVAQDKLKILAAGETLVYVRLSGGRKVTPEVISNIPKAFDPKLQWFIPEKLTVALEKHLKQTVKASVIPSRKERIAA